MDGEKIAVEAELAVALSLRASDEVNTLTEVRLGEKFPTQGAACVICYPMPSDTLWSVAKRYHTPVQTIRSNNRVADLPADAPDSLAGVSYLII